MTKDKAKERVLKLKKEISRHRYLYHVLDKQEISDEALDSLKHELKNLEEKYPDLITEDSPTQRVGGEPLPHFKKVSHKKPMLSLEDVFDESEFEGWVKKISKVSSLGQKEFFGELKIDGFAVSLVYKNGSFKTGATRGDGRVGEDVTQNLKTIEAIPLKLRLPSEREVKKTGVSLEKPREEIEKGEIEVRGEVFMAKKVFESINQEQKKRGMPQYANPRNTAAGSIRQLNPKIASSRQLDFLAYGLASDVGQTTHSQEHKLLSLLGFKTDKLARELKGEEEIYKFWKEVSKKREKLEWEIDGLVITVNSNKVFNNLGVVGKAPRGMVAFKFPGEEATTVVEDIIVQVGRTGTLTPVAVLKPVAIRGVTVKRASLHNMDEIERLGVKIGDTVIVERAGDVIPRVTKVLLKLRPKSAKSFSMPKKCPVCGGSVKKEGVYYRCQNKKCPALRRENLYHITAKGTFNIVGLGPKIIDKLYEQGLLGDGADIFNLKEEDIAPLEGMGAKSAENIIKAIKEAKKITLARFIHSLGILHVGEETAYDLANYFGDIEDLKKATQDELERIPNVGEVVAKSIYEWFSNETNKKFLEKFLKKVEIVNPKRESQKLKGLTFVFTGTLKNLGREEAEEKVRQNGGNPSSSVSKNTDYVVAGENPGSKHNKARELGVKIIDEKEFEKLVT